MWSLLLGLFDEARLKRDFGAILRIFPGLILATSCKKKSCISHKKYQSTSEERIPNYGSILKNSDKTFYV